MDRAARSKHVAGCAFELPRAIHSGPGICVRAPSIYDSGSRRRRRRQMGQRTALLPSPDQRSFRKRAGWMVSPSVVELVAGPQPNSA
jgi:hypothetical protein